MLLIQLLLIRKRAISSQGQLEDVKTQRRNVEPVQSVSNCKTSTVRHESARSSYCPLSDPTQNAPAFPFYSFNDLITL